MSFEFGRHLRGAKVHGVRAALLKQQASVLKKKLALMKKIRREKKPHTYEMANLNNELEKIKKALNLLKGK